MSAKFKTLAAIYISAALIVLSLYAYVSTSYLDRLRLLSGNGAGQCFEESAYAVGELSQALQKSAYAADSGMCARVCAEIYANAMYAEATLASLPFETQELETLQSFLNTAGDYAYTLCAQAAETGFSPENVEVLTKMSSAAAEYSSTLMSLRSDLSGGKVTMDSMENRLRNFPEDENVYLSAVMLDYEQGLDSLGDIDYDGRYCPKAEEEKCDIPEEEMREQAAEFIRAPKLAFEYAGGMRCYTDGERSLIVGRSGVQSMWSSRLVETRSVSQEDAETAASEFLTEKGFDNLSLSESNLEGNLAVMSFVPEKDGTSQLSAAVKIAVALDDGSIFAFERADCGDAPDVEWAISEDEAKNVLPDGVECESVRKTVIKTPGSRQLACYELDCGGAKVYVNAETGKQQSIVLQ